MAGRVGRVRVASRSHMGLEFLSGDAEEWAATVTIVVRMRAQEDRKLNHLLRPPPPIPILLLSTTPDYHKVEALDQLGGKTSQTFHRRDMVEFEIEAKLASF